MSVNYYVTLAVGVRVEADELERVFGRTTEEVSHEEPRFDPRTGLPAAPKIVIDEEAETTFVLDAAQRECLEDLAAALAEKIGCGWSAWDDPPRAFLFGPELNLDDNEACDDGLFSCSGGAAWSDIAAMDDELARIKTDLRNLGVHSGPARVAPMWSIC